MPAIVVAAALYAGATMATVGVAAMSTWAIIGSVGAISAGVGVVTGNKDLIKIGAVMGIVGGVGALATSAGAMSAPAAEAAAADTAATPAATSTDPSAPGAVAKETMSNVVPDTSAASPVTTNAASTIAEAAAPAAPAPVAGDASGIVNQAATPTVPSWEPPEPTIFDTAKTYGAEMGKFAKENQMLTYGMMTVGGGFMQGLFKQPTVLDKAQADAASAQAELLRQRAANMGAPLPGATATARRPVYSSTTRPAYAAPGLINTVTGVPA